MNQSPGKEYLVRYQPLFGWWMVTELWKVAQKTGEKVTLEKGGPSSHPVHQGPLAGSSPPRPNGLPAKSKPGTEGGQQRGCWPRRSPGTRTTLGVPDHLQEGLPTYITDIITEWGLTNSYNNTQTGMKERIQGINTISQPCSVLVGHYGLKCVQIK